MKTIMYRKHLISPPFSGATINQFEKVEDADAESRILELASRSITSPFIAPTGGVDYFVSGIQIVDNQP